MCIFWLSCFKLLEFFTDALCKVCDQTNYIYIIYMLYIDEIEDCTSRLKASRLRVADLEKQLALSNTQKSRAETKSGDNSKQLDQLKTNLYTKRWVRLWELDSMSICCWTNAKKQLWLEPRYWHRSQWPLSKSTKDFERSMSCQGLVNWQFL